MRPNQTTEIADSTATHVRIASAAGAAGAIVPFALSSFSGDSGAAITADLVAKATTLQIGAGIAAFVAALLLLGAVRLGRVVGGTAGGVVTAAGAAVAVLYAFYYAAFGAGAVVADQMLTNPGPGIGEATALLANVAELCRYAPGLALVVAAVVVRRSLPRWVWITAGVLTVMTVVPMTSWIAALLIPVWLGASAAGVTITPRPAGHAGARG